MTTIDDIIKETTLLGVSSMKMYLEYPLSTQRNIEREKAVDLISFANNLISLVDRGIIKGRDIV